MLSLRRIWEQAAITMLGKEEAKEVDPQEREFLAACLRVRRERGARTLPTTHATPLHTPAKSRLGHRWVPAHTPSWPSASDTIRRRASRPAGHFLATSAISDGQDWSPETLDGKEGLRAAVEKLLMTTAALQAQEAAYARGARCERSFDVAFRWDRYAQRTGRAPGQSLQPAQPAREQRD